MGIAVASGFFDGGEDIFHDFVVRKLRVHGRKVKRARIQSGNGFFLSFEAVENFLCARNKPQSPNSGFSVSNCVLFSQPVDYTLECGTQEF